MRTRRRDRMAVNGEINVVSLIDVMMLLMVIFMITAPIMQGGIDVTLPKAQSTALDSKSALIVTVERNGRITVDGARMSEEDFALTIKALATRKGKDGVYLQADSAVPYGTIARLLGAIRTAGIPVGLVTEPEQERRP